MNNIKADLKNAVIRQALVEYLANRECFINTPGDITNGIDRYVADRYRSSTGPFKDSRKVWLKPRIEMAFEILEELGTVD